ncbi:MAG TPA: EAL domain-containing protein [Acetobacteraceae bacterium]
MLSRFARLAALVGHARARNLVVACGLLLGVALAAVGVWIINDLRLDHISHEKKNLTNLSYILAEEMDRRLQALDLLHRGLIEHLRQLGIASPEAFEQQMRTIEVHRDLTERIAGLPQIAALSLHDRHGNLINFSRFWPPPQIDAHDRDFIGAVLAPDAPKLFIGEPVQSRATGRWTIYFSSRFEAPDGQLIGIIVSLIQADDFERLFSQLTVDDDGSFAVYRSDGMLLVRYPHVDPRIGTVFGQTENYNRMLGALDHGIARLTSMFDGKDRLVAGHSVAHYPLIIAVTNTTDGALEAWRSKARAFAIVIAFLELVIAATVVLAVRHLRGYEKLQAAEAAQARAEERERGAHALHRQGQRFDTALNNMLQGLLMFDHDGRLLVVNRRFSQMFGVPDGTLLPGMTYLEVTDRIIDAGQVTAEDMTGVREHRAELVARNEHATATWEISSGRAFAMTHQPMEDGWLTTFEEISDRRRTEARMVHLAHHDALTDLPNRALFHKQLKNALAFARESECLALLCLDLDQFKAVNDTLGHPVGDALLLAVADRLVRRTRETHTVARLGGDEFAIIQAPIAKLTEAVGLADRLIELFDEPFDVAGHRIVIGTSIGVAFAPQDGADADQLLKSADLALYRAKLDGRGVYRLFRAEMDAQMQERRLLELDLRQALSAGQFELFYQPQVNLRIGEVTGFESLLRWHHPERGLVSPATFIPLAEEIGLIVPIGEWVLRQACATAASWPSDIRVAVNLSAAQFKSLNLVAVVSQALRASGLAPERLELEITETVMLQDTDATMATLHQLRALGAGIAMDDFGTGYSSLSYLRCFPFDRIKIDQSFVRELSTRRDCGAIVRAVAGLSAELGMATTAEGVETREQLDLLVSAGCTEVQGYLFSPAVPSEAVIGVLDTIAITLTPPIEIAVSEPVE